MSSHHLQLNWLPISYNNHYNSKPCLLFNAPIMFGPQNTYTVKTVLLN